MNKPAKGDPKIVATPWNSNNKPNALVSLSSPKSWTVITDRRAAKHAIKENKMEK